MKNTENRRFGFTLSEVLITIGIIGVVAILTVPTLIKNYQKSEYINGFKKATAVFDQALIQLANDKGCPGDLKCTGLFPATNDVQAFGDELTKYLKVAKNCQMNIGQGCVAKFYDYDNTTGTSYDYDISGTRYKFADIDGVTYTLNILDANCTPASYSSADVTGNMSQPCGRVYIDVNGPKGPNWRGRDVLSFWITNGKGPLLYPTSGADDKYNGTSFWWKFYSPVACSNNSGRKMGTYCAGRVVEEGWQMNYW